MNEIKIQTETEKKEDFISDQNKILKNTKASNSDCEINNFSNNTYSKSSPNFNLKNQMSNLNNIQTPNFKANSQQHKKFNSKEKNICDSNFTMNVNSSAKQKNVITEKNIYPNSWNDENKSESANLKKSKNNLTNLNNRSFSKNKNLYDKYKSPSPMPNRKNTKMKLLQEKENKIMTPVKKIN